MNAPNLLTSRWYAALAVGVAAFTVYGSYVPFDYRPRPWDEATAAFDRTVRATLWPTSRSDWAANWCLGVPLGFFLLGAMRVDRPGRAATAALGAAVVPACLTFAAVVEFGQLSFAGRTCCGSDIWAQGLGAACGVTAWVFAGQRLTDAARQSLSRLDGTRNLLIVYACCALTAQTLPFDLTASPADWYRRLRDRTVTLVPLGELAARPGVTAVEDWKKVAAWCELLALAIPGGLLVAGLGGRWKSVNALPQVAVAGLAAGAVLELAQWPVQSRHPSTTDVLVLAFGVLVGWGIALAVTDKGSRKYRPRLAAVFWQLWLGVLCVHQWQPFEFHPPLLAANAGRASWLPFDQQIGKTYLWGLEEIVRKVWLFAPLGVAAAWGWKRSSDRRATWYAVGGCAAAGVLLEFGQLLQPSRVGSPTDVLFAVAGGWAGAFVTRRRLAAAAAPKPFVPRTGPVAGSWWAVNAAPKPVAPTPDEPTQRAMS